MDGILEAKSDQRNSRGTQQVLRVPERNWPGTTHTAIAGVKVEMMSRVEAEFDRHDGASEEEK